MPPIKRAIFLSGPIGVGKTTLGRAVAARLGGGFLDGDDYSDPKRRWYTSELRTSQAIVAAAMARLATVEVVVIAWPLRCINWVYFTRTCADRGITPMFVTLRAPYAHIVAADRGRAFSEAERERIKVMIAEGYGDRAFSDLIFDTDRAPFEITANRLATVLQAAEAGPAARASTPIA